MRKLFSRLAIVMMLAGPAAAEDADAITGLECVEPPYTAADTAARRHLSSLLADVREALDPFPSLVAALDNATIPICVDLRSTDALGYLDIERNLLAVSDSLDRDQQWIIIVHELRHLEQYSRGFCPSDDLSMNENARAVFAMEADAQAVTTLVAWAARDVGQDGPWAALAAWREYRDIAESYEDEMRSSGDIGLAVGAAFAQWYESDRRITRYYQSSCGDYLDRQESSKRLPSYEALASAFYDTLCRLPDGTRYDCAPPDTR